jgi:alpha-beta hydrolase superfamily lysophospholipase
MNRLCLLAALVLASCSPPPSEPTMPAIPLQPFGEGDEHKDLNFQFVRTAGAAPYAADVQECIDTAARIVNEQTAEAWYREWYALAERVRLLGESHEQAGRAKKASAAYARASNYYRNAGFFLSEQPLDARLEDSWARSVSIFAKAAALHDPPIERIEIPYGETVLPAHFYRASQTGKRSPTLIVHQGFDGSKEESMGWGVVAQQHGYNCLIFEGPGQGEVIHQHHVPFIAEWEKVVTPVVDALVQRSDVDPAKIALLGLSMGGYLAPRAASGEHRLAAVVANGGVFSVFEGLAAKWVAPDRFQSAEQLLGFIKSSPKEFDGMIEGASASHIGLRWAMVHGVYTFGAKDPADYYLKTVEMTLEKVVEQITCPVLVIDSESDDAFPDQPSKLFHSLKAPKDFLMFTKAEGADLHCQAGAFEISAEKTFAWLDRVLGR